MLELRPTYYDDGDYDGCGNTAHAVLELSGMKILLCEDCLNSLIEDVHKFENTVFCHQCIHFKMSTSGFKYGGSCLKKASENNETLSLHDYGYKYSVECMDTCNHALREVDHEQQN